MINNTRKNIKEENWKLSKNTKRRRKRIVHEVLALESKMKEMTDEELQGQTALLKDRLSKGESLNDIQAEAFALVREAHRRIRMEHPYPVQIEGACVLHQGDIAEMKTGEGKTLTATMAVYLHALEGKGVHVVTVNEYLSERDAKNMGMVYNFLGLSVGINKSILTKDEKRHAYACDITYSTNSELGFDYLRDNMVYRAKDKVMRGLHFALIDEADSVLIDEARTPLIISSSAHTGPDTYTMPDQAVKSLVPDDYRIDIETKQIYLVESGIEKIEKYFGIDNLYDIKNSGLVHRIQQALKANFIMRRDFDYMRTEDGISIIDQFTGRVMPSRQYSNGLHQAIEAKESTKINQEATTVATITYQNFFRLYDKLAGMTGTAKTEEEEFLEIYNMRVIPIATHKPIRRIDQLDKIYTSQDSKYRAILNQVKDCYSRGQPVLIGTVSVENNEKLHALLENAHLPHEVLNAKNHAREAEIIAKAGQVGAITVATNMAGRGTDIKLSADARKLGGLMVIGTEHHESRRIDNQLRGRSGRQGDPGESRFFVALDDELLLRFGKDAMKKRAASLPLDAEVESKFLTKSIISAQKRVEGSNFDSRKQLIRYDDVLRKQRETIYSLRDTILHCENMRDKTKEEFTKAVRMMFDEMFEKNDGTFQDRFANLLAKMGMTGWNPSSEVKKKEREKLRNELARESWRRYENITLALTPRIFEIEKDFYLHILDDKWQSHIDAMDKLRESIHLRSYAQNDPLQQYIKEAYLDFSLLFDSLAKEYMLALSNIKIQYAMPKNFEIQRRDYKG